VAYPAGRRRANALGPMQIVVGLVAGFGMILWLANNEEHKNDPPPPKPPLTPEQQERQVQLDEGITTAETLRASMKDPASFQLSSVIATNDTHALCFEFRGRNGFNGVSVDHAVYDRDKDKLTPEHSASFASIWKAKCYLKNGRDIASSITYALR
jgi:hypothetical protein